MYGGGGGSSTDNVPEMPRTVSLDEGLSSYNEVSGSLPVSHAEEEEKASDYIKKIFGEDLGIILSECALTKPLDPILYLADLLERLDIYSFLFIFFIMINEI